LWDKRSSLFGRGAFTYDAVADHYTCWHGTILHWDRHDDVNQTYHYHADAITCNACPLKAKCTTSKDGRTIRRSFFQEYLDRVAGTIRPKRTRRRIANERSGLNPCLVKPNSSMA
jgi:hypothetical protein